MRYSSVEPVRIASKAATTADGSGNMHDRRDRDLERRREPDRFAFGRTGTDSKECSLKRTCDGVAGGDERNTIATAPVTNHADPTVEQAFSVWS